ncbi:BMP family lipoprotein [Ureibacillus sp. MALMAid1270]|uniref:BMP family lipoprotein n=1 Tax=Ureibacillus sp. MALMAid1270 TaxID=3411629 RepID=UPI003BA6787A
MKKRKFGFAIVSILAVGTLLGACGTKDEGKDNAKNDEDTFSVAMVTDEGGIDDKSFNQSTWEGIEQFGKENGLKKGNGGYDYLQSESEADYVTNLTNLIQRDFDLVFGVGYKLHNAVVEVAEQRPNAKIAIIDEVVPDIPNVASIMFNANEASYLAGVAAALETKTGKVGFIGGMEGAIIGGFEAGFVAGVEAANPDVEVLVQYVDSFTDAEKGRSIAALMYDQGADIIFHAAGGSGNGLFTEAKERKQKDPNANVWVIGVDRDQYDEGQVNADTNVVLTSVLKEVGIAAQEVAKLAQEGKFPGGELITYGLADNGVSLADDRGALSDETKAQIEEYKQKIIDGEIEVPNEPK